MNPQINGPIEEEKKNQVNESCYSGSNNRFPKQIFYVITHLKFISNALLSGQPKAGPTVATGYLLRSSAI